MNIDSLHFQISELRDHVDTLLGEINAGEYDDDSDLALATWLGHLLDHINLAWNTRNHPDGWPNDISQEEFERAMNTVPNFGFRRVLSTGLDYDCTKPT